MSLGVFSFFLKFLSLHMCLCNHLALSCVALGKFACTHWKLNCPIVLHKMKAWPHSTARAMAGRDIKWEAIFRSEIIFHSWVLEGCSKAEKIAVFWKESSFSYPQELLNLDIRNVSGSGEAHKKISTALFISSKRGKDIRRCRTFLHFVLDSAAGEIPGILTWFVCVLTVYLTFFSFIFLGFVLF